MTAAWPPTDLPCLPTIYFPHSGRKDLTGEIDHITPCLTSIRAHRIKYKLLVRSPRPFMTLFWPTSLTSSCDIVCLTHFAPAIPTFLRFLPLSFFNSPMLLTMPQSLCTCCFPVLDSVAQLFRWRSDGNLKWLFLIFYQEHQLPPTPPLFSIPLMFYFLCYG